MKVLLSGKALILAVAVATVTLMPLASWANNSDPGNNNPPPVGAILDLSGTPIPGGGNGTTYQQYSVGFTGGVTNTAITFALREDPAFLSLTDISVVDQTTSSGNLLTNGNFQGGIYTDNGNGSTPVGWTYANQYGATFGGVVDTSCSPAPSGNSDCWYDGAVQAYDAISQSITTTVGDNYLVSFYLADNSGCGVDGGPPCNFSDLSTNGDVTDTGGNGINLTVYAQAGLPPAATPEPSSLVLLGAGVLGLVGTIRRKIGR